MCEKLKIEISNDEALILYDFLNRLNEEENNVIKNDSEKVVLFHIEGLLEKNLSEVFDPNYKDLLRSAYRNILSD